MRSLFVVSFHFSNGFSIHLFWFNCFATFAFPWLLLFVCSWLRLRLHLFSLSLVSRPLTDWKLQTPRWPSEPARSCTSSTTSRWCPTSASSSSSSSTSSFLRSFYVFLRSCGHNAWTAKLQVGRFYSLSVGSNFSWSFLVLKWIIFFGPELFTKAVLFFLFGEHVTFPTLKLV